MKEELEALEAYKEKLAEYLESLQAWHSIHVENPHLHIIPALNPSTNTAQVDVINFESKKGPQPGAARIEGIPAAFFYEAYREKIGEIFERAIELAEDSPKQQAEQLKAKLAEEEKELAETKKALNALAKKSGGRKKAAS